MVPDVSTGDPNLMLCLNCARRTVSPRIQSKYSGLTRYLKFRGAFTDYVKLTFARIDGLIGTNLPMSAYRTETWWNNSSASAHAKGWLDAGWEVQEVNLKEGYVTLKKVREVPMQSQSSKYEIKKPFTPVPVRRLRSKTPSKTKASKLYARIKNLERQRASKYGLSRGFKARPQYEKRLYKSDKRPS